MNIAQLQFSRRRLYVVFCRQCGPVAEIRGSSHVPYEFTCPRCGQKAKVTWRRTHYRPKGKQLFFHRIEIVHVKSAAFSKFMEFFQQKTGSAET